MWLFDLAALYKQELALAVAAGALFGLALRLSWSSLAASVRDPAGKRLIGELDDASTFVRMGAAFGMFIGAHMILDAVARRKAPLESGEGLLVYLLFVGAAFSLVMGLRGAMLRLAQRALDAEQAAKAAREQLEAGEARAARGARGKPGKV